MGRKKKLPLPAEANVEAIVWRDHSESQKLNVDPTILRLVTVGMNVYEDDEQVILATSVREDGFDDLFDEGAEVTSTQILKPDIVTRTPVGVYKHGA